MTSLQQSTKQLHGQGTKPVRTLCKQQGAEGQIDRLVSEKEQSGLWPWCYFDLGDRKFLSKKATDTKYQKSNKGYDDGCVCRNAENGRVLVT